MAGMGRHSLGEILRGFFGKAEPFRTPGGGAGVGGTPNEALCSECNKPQQTVLPATIALFLPGSALRRAERLAFSVEPNPECFEAMPLISADNPLYFITAVTHKRLPVFRQERLKRVLAMAFDEARRSGGFMIFAYVVMLDHYHVITDGGLKPSDVVRYLNGIAARRVINYLKENAFESSLDKLRKAEEGRKGYRHSVWEHHSNTFLITSESMLVRKVNYIHQNPVVEGLAETCGEYTFSSSRFWNRKPLMDDEPLVPDIKHLSWKSGGGASL